MSVIHTTEPKSVSARILVLPGVLFIAFTAFIIRLWYWQVVKADEYREKVNQAGTLKDESLAPRGRIFDRNGLPIAAVQPKLVVTVKPAVVAKNPEILTKLAEILQTDKKKLIRSLDKQRHRGNLPVPVFVGTTLVKAGRILEAGQELESVDVVTEPMRVAINKTDYSHVLGWVSVSTKEIDDRLKEKGIVPADYVGRDGIEQVYEEKLMGTPGSQVFAVDLARRPLRPLQNTSPKPGSGLILGIDSDLQKLAHSLLGNRKGAIVALDPRNGEVLCMASTPTFDLSMLEGGLTTDEFQFLYENKDRPMFKRAIAGLYPPGSTGKILTSISAELAGKFNPGHSVFCPGYLTVGNRKVRCENHAAASMDFYWAFTRSCNSYFGHMAQVVGSKDMQSGLHACGIGEPTEIDLNGAAKGVVPTEESILKNHGRRLSIGDTNNIGIGQGDLLVTPLQMANVAAMVANRGVMYKPHIVKAFIDPRDSTKVNSVKAEVLREIDLSPTFWDTLQSAMKNVVVAGTAKSAQIPGIQVAGKTGSAENSQSRLTHAWFVGYAPYDNPQIAFAVVVEQSGHGGSVAAPLAREIVKKYLTRNTAAPPKKEELDVKIAALP